MRWAGFTVVVMKSTVPVGTGDSVERIIRERRPNADVAVVSNPEFMREGAAIGDFKRPDRIVVGTEDHRARETMAEIYRPLFLNQAPLIYMARRAAELTKYAANAFLATKITFINENRRPVRKGRGRCAGCCARHRTRQPHRFKISPRRPRLRRLVLSQGYDGADPHGAGLWRAAAHRRNGGGCQRGAQAAHGGKILDACGGSVVGKTLAVLGLAFKLNTDDMREAPSLTILPALQSRGAAIRAFDPEAMKQAKPLLPGVTFCDDAYECARDADALIILTEWDAFRALDLSRIHGLAEDAACRRFAQYLQAGRHAQARLRLCERRAELTSLRDAQRRSNPAPLTLPWIASLGSQ